MRNTKGITLIALVITIIVLLILAGVSLSFIAGENGILGRATKAVDETEIGTAQEQANLIYDDLLMAKYEGEATEPTMNNIAKKLREKGYEIKEQATEGNVVTGIKLSEERLSLAPNESKTITVEYEGDSEGKEYYVVLKGENHKMTLTKQGVTIEKKATNLEEGSKANNLEALSSDEDLASSVINENKITITAGNNVGTAIITVSYGTYTAECKVMVQRKPTEASVADASIDISTAYGLIDVIWLEGTTNQVAQKPNAPDLYGNTLTPVTWTQNGNTWSEDEKADQNNWYEYQSIDNTRAMDNTTSRWANAKNSDGSYFVWIPRYAYRIIYYEDETYTKISGYYDGYGQWKADENASLRYELDEGAETVEYQGEKYIVHPAFETNLELGGWDEELSGFWVAKYEMSREGATVNAEGSGTTFYSLPSVRSARNIRIGDMYEYSLKYDSDKESHMMKNSEWGAVAYLAHSQYGRNGYTIDANSTSEYNTETGAKISTTGNVYGIYDMAGGAMEYVAEWDNTSGDSSVSYFGEQLTKVKTNTKYSNMRYREGLGPVGRSR